MGDIVVVGSINMDITLTVPRLPAKGETILGLNVSNYFGGKGANQAVTIGKLGGGVTLLGKVGDDTNGKILVENLKENGVDVSRIDVEVGCPSGTAYINVSEDGENNIVVIPGANNKVDRKYIDKNIDVLINSKICISQLEIPMDTVEYIANICFENGVKFIFNPAPMVSLNKEIIKKTSILIPNETELQNLVDKTINIFNLSSYTKEIEDIGAENIIVTLGNKGSLLITKGTIKAFKAIKVDVVDSTGAGDSFVGAIGYKISKGSSLEDAIEFATVVSGLAVTRKGAQDAIPTLKEVDDFKIKQSQIK